MLKSTITYLAIMLPLISGCQPVGPINHKTTYDGITDPLFDLKSTRTIGLVTGYWTEEGKKLGVDGLIEKTLLAYCKTELENRGYIVHFIPLKNLHHIDGGKQINVRDLKNYPDLILTVAFIESQMKVTVPGQAYSGVYLGQYGGSGWSGGHESYDVPYWELGIKPILWTGAPKYNHQVWRGTVYRTRPIKDFNDQAQNMIENLFLSKFPKISK
ncbi:MAG: hypothetical protein DIZ80_10465 [endosymbiont of Galathealinum brachiosum]|uniref:Uncharacterized protein n=1 Tax=endosymbiont of Galathealinum brachiosum TaxID=2200906 RepID=A0A370DE89_9GAMM|nr:MAG: hypothetical protein DIZ80_10465 [endosymbiont of Galathealinum brachiosum]